MAPGENEFDTPALNLSDVYFPENYSCFFFFPIHTLDFSLYHHLDVFPEFFIHIFLITQILIILHYNSSLVF